MEKRLLLLVFVLLLVSVSLTSAVDDKVAKAYQCLEGKVIGKCSSLSTEEKAFSLLALGECKQEIIDSAKKIDGLPQCWPITGNSGACDILATSKALYSLQASGEDTSAAAEWLISQKMVPTAMDWFLQIETGEETTCDITFQGGSYRVTIAADKKIKTGTGQCFKTSPNGYWLQIYDNCQEKEFKITCPKDFFTNLLYSQKSSTYPIYVSAETNRAYPGDSTTESIKSYCFKQNNACNYEGSLWASFALDFTGNYYSELSAFIPYLIASASNNSKYFPEFFLYRLGQGEYRNQIISKQKTTTIRNTGYWQLSTANDKFYDTALGLYAFPNENFTEIVKAKNWLLTSPQQDANGCWAGSVRDTAFILHAAWPDYGCKLDDECTSTTGKICESRVCIDGCREDGVCGTGKICNNSTNTCITGCREDPDCQDGYLCGSDDKCFKAPDCTVSTEVTKCGLGRICVNNICAAGCRDDNTCEDGYICNASKLCVEGCRNDTICGTGKICNLNNTCVDGCRTNQQCSLVDANKPICDITKSTCAECTSTNTTMCAVTEKCIDNDCIPKEYECIGDSHCTNSSKPICDQDTNKCVRCRYDTDCGNSTNPRLECSLNNTCVIKPECRYDSECNITTQICNNITNKCVPKPACLIDRDCGLGEKCESQHCIIGCRDDNNCPTANICLNNTCGTGCRDDNNCPDNKPFCSLNNICIECKVNSDCFPGYDCSSNKTCIPVQVIYCETSYDCPGDEICNNDGVCEPPITSKPRCIEDKGYFCRVGVDCIDDGGNLLDDQYDCNVPDKCCSLSPVTKSCLEQSGIICSSGKICEGGIEIYEYSDSRTGELCCSGGGTCADSGGGLSQCELGGGACRVTCLDGEEVSYDTCTLSSDACCITSGGGSSSGGGGTTPTKSYLWLWIFLILIVLAILGFVFRDKLRILLMRMKGNKGGPSRGPLGFPGIPPPTSSLPMRRPISRMIMPPGQPRPMMRGPPPFQTAPPVARPQPPVAKQENKTETKKSSSKEKPKSELDDVLKKLKDMGK